jgi:hypothetical protein
VGIGGLDLGALINSRSEGTKPAHGPYRYAYLETGDRRRPGMHKRYSGRASATASPEELRAIVELGQPRRAEAAERKRRRGTGSDTGSRPTGDRRRQNGQQCKRERKRGHVWRHGQHTGITGRTGRSRYDRNKNDPFSRRRPPPIEQDFASINAKRGATFEARQAYREAA